MFFLPMVLFFKFYPSMMRGWKMQMKFSLEQKTPELASCRKLIDTRNQHSIILKTVECGNQSKSYACRFNLISLHYNLQLRLPSGNVFYAIFLQPCLTRSGSWPVTSCQFYRNSFMRVSLRC